MVIIVKQRFQNAMSTPSKKRMRLDKEQARIVIVGGGLAGLSAAVALEKAGFTKISLFERDLSFEQQKEGYGLTLTYNPKGPLASLGILENIAQQDCPSRSHYVFRVSEYMLFHCRSTVGSGTANDFTWRWIPFSFSSSISSPMEAFWDILEMPFPPTVESVKEEIYGFQENFSDEL